MSLAPSTGAIRPSTALILLILSSIRPRDGSRLTRDSWVRCVFRFELQLALRNAGQDASKAKEMVAAADTDGDGEIDFDEFVEIINSNFQTDEWLMFSTSLKARLVKKAKAAYQNVVPVVPVVPLAGKSFRQYPFPDPDGSNNCGKAIVGGWIITILAIMFLPALPFLVIADLYFMATQSTNTPLHLMGLKYVNMHGQDVGICKLFALVLCSSLFLSTFGIEVWAAFCDPETRTLSMQVMGLRFRNFDDTSPAGAVEIDVQRLPPATLRRLESAFLAIIMVMVVAAIAVAVVSGLACMAQCEAALIQTRLAGRDFDNFMGGGFGSAAAQYAADVCMSRCPLWGY